MPRAPRIRTDEGVYHVILRGSGRQILFENDADRRLFLMIASESMSDAGISVLAWCLMSNHVHLLLFDPQDALSAAVQRFSSSYAGHFNRLTGHVGHVFAGRFKSVPVTSDRQLLQVVRYIHDNPERAGICAASEYPWSSFGEYVSGNPVIVDVNPVLDMLGGTDGFRELSQSDEYAGYTERTGAYVSDDAALAVARLALGGSDPSELKSLSPVERNPRLQALRDEGLTIRQIERLTGIGRSTISHTTYRKPLKLA